MIANRTDDLPHYFPEGRACLAAADAKEFRAHCEFAIANPGEASRIAATAGNTPPRTRTLRGHK